MEQPFSATFAQTIMEEKINLIDILKNAQVDQVLFSTLISKVCEENLKFKRDIPLTAYIDFETTAPTDDCLDPENEKMSAVSYVIIFAFHPELQIDRVITERSFGHSQARLLSLNYLTTEQMKFKNVT